ncbi:hypothetical protein ID866_3576 [Astraeus odoratus]|nr:hypothetical protein ID866_3576 [Astraeus odoratus]
MPTKATSKSGLKRRATPKLDSSRKRIKSSCSSVDGLPWKTVTGPLDGDDGILELEEVDDVEVVYEDTEQGRVFKFNVLHKPDGGDGEESVRENASSSKVIEKTEGSQTEPSFSFDSATLLPDWHPFGLHPHILQIIHSKKFHSPTPIQAKAIHPGLSGRDVIGVAETGSGKTLAYGLPILHHILSSPRPSSKRKLQALILAPTRELALQVSDHLGAFSSVTSASAKEEPQEVDLSVDRVLPDGLTKRGGSGDRGPLVSVAVLVGGMSAQKQRRILDRGADILVATPGRLWDMLGENEALSKQIQQLRFLVLDEADRMIEAGHFVEMDNILRLTIRQPRENQMEAEGIHHPREESVPKDELQTFVFSATLSKELQLNLKKRSRVNNGKPLSTLDDLLLRLDFRDSQPHVIDLSPEGGTVSTLQLSKLECVSSDKDVYLYYFLLRYPGRSLVFLSAIDGIRRLLPLLELLNLKAFPLHSQLEQRQRLKNLDRYRFIQIPALAGIDSLIRF